MTCVRENIRAASSRKTTAPDSRRAFFGWGPCLTLTRFTLMRLTFVLCGGMVLLMAVHGDEHGHRPRFVWHSVEDTIRVAALETPMPTGRPSLGAIPPSAISRAIPTRPLLASRGLLSSWTASPRRPARLTAYLLPFANGPPAGS
jgi:hypothetical protein